MRVKKAAKQLLVFDDLAVGDVFMFPNDKLDTCYYMKTEERKPVHNFSNAVNLNTGANTVIINMNSQIVKLSCHLVVEE